MKANLKEMTNEELKSLLSEIQAELANRTANNSKIVELSYNKYKGTGKCWIASIVKETKKIVSFLEAESVQPRDNYSGKKTFSVPLIEGKSYLFCESGSKSTDSRDYYTVENGELVSF